MEILQTMSKANSYIRRVEVKTTLRVSLEKAWQLIEDVGGYARYVKFMKRAWLVGAFVEGNYWTDISTVMFLPLRINHQIAEVKKGRKAVFIIKLPFRGRVLQICTLTPVKKMVELKLTAEIDWHNKLLDLMLGEVLEKRTKAMFEGSLDKFKRSVV